jgi:hypothetical protein
MTHGLRDRVVAGVRKFFGRKYPTDFTVSKMPRNRMLQGCENACLKSWTFRFRSPGS